MKLISFITMIVVVIVVACAMAMAPPQSSSMKTGGPQADRATTYEHLATAIIAIRETENSLVHGMLADHLARARAHLHEASGASGADRQRPLEAAATEIANLASEGDKRIQAVRQKLLKAGHHHHTDSETNEDYVFIDSREKGALLAHAGTVARMRQASSADILAAAARLTELFEQAVKSE